MKSQEIINEIKMAPGFLSKEAAKIGALAGMEFEMIVPDSTTFVGSESGQEEDLEYDQYVTDLDDLIPFFTENGMNTRKEVAKVVEKIKNEYGNWKEETIQKDWLDQKEDIVEEMISNDPPSKEKMLAALNIRKDNISYEDLLNDFISYVIDKTPDEFEYYIDEAYETFLEEWNNNHNERYLLMDFLEDEGWSSMHRIANSFSLMWPRWIETSQSRLEAIAESFGKALNTKVEIGKTHGSAPRGNWYSLEPDPSVQALRRDEPGEGLEFISPPKSIHDIMTDVEEVREWALTHGCYTNDKCGLHINVSLPERQQKVDFLKLALLVGDEHVLADFDRLVGHGAEYAASIVRKLRSFSKNNPSSAAHFLDMIKRGHLRVGRYLFDSVIGSKYVSINPKLSYIEFRSPGGDWLGLNFAKIGDTLNRFVVALDAAAKPDKYRKEYLKKLYQVLHVPPTADSGLHLFVRYVAGEINKEYLIRALQKSPAVQARRGKTEKDNTTDLAVNKYFVGNKTDEPISEQQTPKIGINVRDDGQIFYADMIVDGKKTLESRDTDSLRPYVNKRVAIVKTGSGPALAIGEATVGEPIQVDEKEFRRLEKQHRVPAGTKFDIKPNSTKYLYPMINVKRYEHPKKVGKGIVGRKVLNNVGEFK